MPAPAARFPDAFVFAPPVVADPVDEPAQRGPEVVADWRAVFVEQVDAVHQLAVDVELELSGGPVADADGFRSAVAVELVEGEFGEVVLAVDAVKDL